MLAERASERVDSVLDDPEVDPVVMRRLGATSGLWVPLVARGRGIGVLAAHDKEDALDKRFTEDDLRLAETFASRAAVAVDLSERVARDALRRVVAAQELERRRLARELHDETGQALASILLGLRGLESLPDPARAHEALAELRELAVATLRDVRRLAVDLHPKALDDFGLVSALERLLETWREQTGIAVELASRLGGEELPPEAATALYRIVQEALDERGQARRVLAMSASSLTYKNGRVVAVIEDDGQGFDPAGRGASARDREHARARSAARRPLPDRVGAERLGNDARGGGAGRVSIRVMIVDDHAVVRAGLRMLIDAEDDLETVAEAGNVRDAIFEARSTNPDLVLMDIVMPGESGLQGVPKLLHEHPELKILVLSMQDDPRYVREAFAAGARGYVLKEAADAEVVQAIREVAGGGRYVHPELGARLVAAETEALRRAESDPLSDREREVLTCSRTATRTRRSPSSSSSPSGRPRPIAPTSCRSSGSRRAPSSSATHSRTACSNHDRT